MAVGWCAKSSMIVMPLTWAFDFEAALYTFESLQRKCDSFGAIRHEAARAAAAVAFQTLYSPAKAESRSLPSVRSSCSTVQRCTFGFQAEVQYTLQFGTRTCAVALNRAEGLRQTTLQAGAFVASPAAPSKAMMRPRRGMRLTRRLKAVSTASRSL